MSSYCSWEFVTWDTACYRGWLGKMQGEMQCTEVATNGCLGTSRTWGRYPTPRFPAVHSPLIRPALCEPYLLNIKAPLLSRCHHLTLLSAALRWGQRKGWVYVQDKEEPRSACWITTVWYECFFYVYNYIRLFSFSHPVLIFEQIWSGRMITSLSSVKLESLSPPVSFV